MMEPSAFWALGGVAVFLAWFAYMHYQTQKIKGHSTLPLVRRFPGLSEQQPALIFCHSPYCAPCKHLLPKFQQWSKENDRVYVWDVSEDFELAKDLGIRATPSVLLVRNGIVEHIQVGRPNFSKLRQWLYESKA